jgi:hypothetical protein
MGQPHACLYFVTVLAAWPGRDKKLDVTVAFKGGAVSWIHVSHGYALASTDTCQHARESIPRSPND